MTLTYVNKEDTENAETCFLNKIISVFSESSVVNVRVGHPQ
jgi:hypothetical protein